jgi:hypothetical protein
MAADLARGLDAHRAVIASRGFDGSLHDLAASAVSVLDLAEAGSLPATADIAPSADPEVTR